MAHSLAVCGEGNPLELWPHASPFAQGPNAQAGRRYRYRKRSRSVCEQATESYLRVDISCGSEACPLCPRTLPSLAATADHYAIPDAATLDRFSEVFEVPEVANVIYLTSVIRPVGGAEQYLAMGWNHQNYAMLHAASAFCSLSSIICMQ